MRERALRALSRREHGRQELGRKLLAHAEHPDDVEALLDALEAGGLLSDERYAEARVASRGRRFSSSRLRSELVRHGVDGETADCALEAHDDMQVARAVWVKKFGGLPQDAREQARQIRFMAGRGFDYALLRRLWDTVREHVKSENETDSTH